MFSVSPSYCHVKFALLPHVIIYALAAADRYKTFLFSQAQRRRHWRGDPGANEGKKIISKMFGAKHSTGMVNSLEKG